MSANPPLERYNQKRDFGITSEPAGKAAQSGETLSFVIQKHWATRLHYDFRLELDGVLLSWAVPKGPSYDPSVKRMAIHVEDHPVSYGGFEGQIPEKQYGAGKVIVWDRGTWEPIGDPRAGMKAGKVVFALHGEKMAGQWELVRIAKPDDRQEAWLLFKKRDGWARPEAEYDVVAALPDSVIEKPLGAYETRESPSTPAAAAPAPAQARPARTAGKAATKNAATNQTKTNTKAATKAEVPQGAVKAPLPATLSPQLATLVKSPPTGGDWSVEAKFDGYRLLARIEKGRARLITRRGNDWTDRLDSVGQAVESTGIREGWLDGEVVVLNDVGGQDFNALQNAIDEHKNGSITFFLFDAPFLDGYDLRRVPLWQRRALLKAALEQQPNDRIRFSDDFPSSPAEVLEAACAMKLEGVIVKRRDAPYVSTRNEQWIKLKCTLRQEFVIGGYTDRTNSTTEVGNLLLGVYEDGKLRYAGAVGTGWSAETSRALKQTLEKLETDRTPFETGSTKQTRWSRRTPGGEHWVRPEQVCEVTFAEWTPEGHLRHASFQALREDKPAKAVIREQAVDAPSGEESGADDGADEARAAIAEKAARKIAKRASTGATVPGKAARKPAAAKSSAAAKGASAKEGASAGKAAVGAAKKATTASTTATRTEEPAAPAANATLRKGDGLVGGIRVSSAERIIDPASKTTKLELVRYYDSVADLILPQLKGRPVSLVRGPNGVGGELFFQKHLEGRIAGMTELDPGLWPGHASMMEVASREALLSAAQMNTIEFHTWNATTRTIGKPDRMVFDLDPGEGVHWPQIQEAAVLTHAILDQLGLKAFLKTSGGKGLHVVVPLAPRADWDTVKGFSQAVVQHLAKTIPDRFVAKSGGSNRVGKIFVDYLRNGLGATTAVAFSARARPGLGVSIPIAWDELGTVKSGAQWTVRTAREFLSFRKEDPWADYATTKQTLTEAMKTLGYKPGK